MRKIQQSGALAPTGMGKEEPRVTNKRLAGEVGILGSIPDAIASGEGLEDAMMGRSLGLRLRRAVALGSGRAPQSQDNEMFRYLTIAAAKRLAALANQRILLPEP